MFIILGEENIVGAVLGNKAVVIIANELHKYKNRRIGPCLHNSRGTLMCGRLNVKVEYHRTAVKLNY